MAASGEQTVEANTEPPPVPVSRLLGLALPYWPPLAAAAVLLLVATSAGLGFPLGVRELLDSAFVAGDSGRLGQVALVLAALFTVQAAADYGQGYLASSAGERLVFGLRARLADHVLRLSLRFFDTHKTGELITILGSDVGMVRQGVLDAVLHLLPQLFRLVGSLAIVGVLNWRLTLVVLVVGPLTGGLSVYVGRRVRKITQSTLEQLGKATAVLNEALAAQRVIKAFGREGYESQRYRDRMREALAAALHRSRAESVLGPTNELLFSWAMCCVLWFGGQEVLAGRLTPGEVVAFIIYFGGVSGPIRQLSRQYTQIQQALGAAQRVFGLLDEQPHVADVPGAMPFVAGAGRVVFQAVSFGYAPDRPALADVAFTAEPGQTVALVGPSGAGKTTVIALLLRLYDATGGHVLVDGQDVRDVTQETLRASLALVPQEPVLFGATVADNIRYGRLDAALEEIQAAARAANAHEFIAALPQGYETPVGERGVQLSAGQRQRIVIARAILRDPLILLLDEATASLDNESEYLVQEALDRLMAGRTTLVVAHRLTTVENADRIVVLDGGRVVEQGRPAELAAAGGLYERLLTRSFVAQGNQGRPAAVR